MMRHFVRARHDPVPPRRGTPWVKTDLLTGKELRDKLRGDPLFRGMALQLGAVLAERARLLLESNPENGVQLNDECTPIGAGPFDPEAVATAERRELANAVLQIAGQLAGQLR